MQYLIIVKALIELLPIVVQIIKMIEETIPDRNVGTQKLEIARTMIQSAYTTATTYTFAFDQLWPMLQPIINATVATVKAAKALEGPK